MVNSTSMPARSSVTTSAQWHLQDLKVKFGRFDFKAKFFKTLQSGICCLKGGDIPLGGAGRSVILSCC